jgi:hypothetical protein
MMANASTPRPRPPCRLTTNVSANAAYPGNATKWPAAYPMIAAPATNSAATGKRRCTAIGSAMSTAQTYAIGREGASPLSSGLAASSATMSASSSTATVMSMARRSRARQADTRRAVTFMSSR